MGPLDPPHSKRYNTAVTAKEILDHALNLSPQERAQLARDIISSLDGGPDRDAEKAWAQEIKRRVEEVRDGTVTLVDWDVVRQRLRTRTSTS